MTTLKAIRLARLFILASSAFAMSACENPTAPTADVRTVVIGTYALSTVDESTLPVPARDVKGRIIGTLTDGALTLLPNGSFTSSMSYILFNGMPMSSPQTGTYSVSDTTVTFVFPGDASRVATFSRGNMLTIAMNAQIFVYRR